MVACDLVLPLEKALDRRGRGGPYNINSFLSDEYTKFVGVICESTTKDAIASDQRSSLRGCGERGGVRIRICGENQSVYVLVLHLIRQPSAATSMFCFAKLGGRLRPCSLTGEGFGPSRTRGSYNVNSVLSDDTQNL